MILWCTCGPGNPVFGHPNGLPSVSNNEYSCSIPNQGFWSAALVIASRAALRWFVTILKKKNEFISNKYQHSLGIRTLKVISNKNRMYVCLIFGLNPFYFISYRIDSNYQPECGRDCTLHTWRVCWVPTWTGRWKSLLDIKTYQNFLLVIGMWSFRHNSRSGAL